MSGNCESCEYGEKEEDGRIYCKRYAYYPKYDYCSEEVGE